MQQISAIDIIIETDSQRYSHLKGYNSPTLESDSMLHLMLPVAPPPDLSIEIF